MLYVLTLCIITLKQHFHLLFLRFTCIFILFDSSISEKNFSVCPNKEVSIPTKKTWVIIGLSTDFYLNGENSINLHYWENYTEQNANKLH